MTSEEHSARVAVVVGMIEALGRRISGSGVAMSLSASALDATSNDDASNWCYAVSPYNADLGTPGAVNPACP